MPTTYIDNKAHARKGKSLVAFNAKKISNLSENLKFTFCCSNNFLAAIVQYYTFPTQFDGIAVHQATRLNYQ